MGAEPRKAANLSLDVSLLSEARALGINLSRAAEDGLRVAVRNAKAEVWQRENASAISSFNVWVDENELPLRAYRNF